MAKKSTDTRGLKQANKTLSTELRALSQRHRALVRSRANYVDLFDFSPVSYALLNTAGVVLNISLAGCRLLGVERSRIIGQPLVSFVIPQDRRELLEHLRRGRSSADTVESELRFFSLSGEPVTCRLYSKAAMYENAQALPTMIVDQTENRALDEARLAAERQKDAAQRQAAVARESSVAKDHFLATVSHELRTPLTPALIAAGRLAAWDEMPDDARRLAATIKRNIELEARLIDDLLDVARVSEDRILLRLDTVDIHQLLRETIRICSPLAEIKDVSVTMHQIARSHYVKGDASRLRQVFWNLLNNAIKFAGPHGTVIVRSFNVADDVVRITVRDDGEGMDEPMLNRLFSPFERTLVRPDSRGGLGLGLAICKGIVSAHGGQIWAASDGFGHGSTFGVEFAAVNPRDAAVLDPSASDPAAAVRADRPQAQSSSARPRVLLVEDDADSSEMLALLLSGGGFDVEVAPSLASGLERLDDHWDIVMSDLKLPDGSGLEVARHAQRLAHPPARLIALTGFGSHDDIAATREAGFDMHLVKPIDPEQLLTACSSTR